MSVDTRGSEFLSIRGKRRASSVKSMRSKYQAGEGDYGGGRALVRVGRGTTEILIGKEDLSTWDMEELRRGRKRDKNGGWQGRDPVIVAKAVHDELVKRTLEKANELLTSNLEEAVKLLADIMKDDQVDAKERLKAIDMIMNRAMGREPQKLEVQADGKWEAAIAHSIVSLPGELVDQHIDNRDEDLDGEEEL